MSTRTENNRPGKEDIVKGKIANAITSAAKNHIVAVVDDIYDADFKEYQGEVNKRVHTNIGSLHAGVKNANIRIDDNEGRIDFLEDWSTSAQDVIDDVPVIERNVSTINNVKLPNHERRIKQLEQTGGDESIDIETIDEICK